VPNWNDFGHPDGTGGKEPGGTGTGITGLHAARARTSETQAITTPARVRGIISGEPPDVTYADPVGKAACDHTVRMLDRLIGSCDYVAHLRSAHHSARR
jgi:hypothetical protein